MDTLSLRQGIERLIHINSSIFVPVILDSRFSCLRCGWCCREHFKIRINGDILRPSNAISIFPDDIRLIKKGTGLSWDDVAQPDIYSCLSDGDAVWAIGWILRRNDSGDCIFYRGGECMIYEFRPMICRCYPFFLAGNNAEIMGCRGLGGKITKNIALDMARMLKRYELKKMRSYIHIIEQVGEKLEMSRLIPLPHDYSGDILVLDGETASVRNL
ncbi:MAG TPA: YkgJ family cysteine cluster protein [Candidatus Methanoperedens sp.]